MAANLPTPTTNPPVFSFEGHQVRVVLQDEDPWFVAADVIAAFGHMKHTRSVILRKLDPDQTRLYRIHTSKVGYTLISESGLYKLVMRSDMPAAKPFQDWVTKEVLPAIRKDGMYVMGEEKVRTGEMTEDELVFKAMTLLKSKAERLTLERDNLKGIVDAHLVNLTIDEWRALNGQYLTRSTILTLAHRMKKRLAELGVEVPRESRTFEHPKRKGHLIPTSVKVYPKHILDEVASGDFGANL